jgi:hypothetical protein
MDLNGTHEFLVYADDVNLMAENVYTVSTVTLFYASKKTRRNKHT